MGARPSPTTSGDAPDDRGRGSGRAERRSSSSTPDHRSDRGGRHGPSTAPSRALPVPSVSARNVEQAGQPATAPSTPNTRTKSRVTYASQLPQVGMYRVDHSRKL